MKALSIKQPWANLLASGEKTIETRLWPTAYRGPLLIVSSKTPKIHPAGCALAIAELVDCRLMTKSDEAAACCACYPGAFSWVMRDIRKIAVFPVRGKLGLYDVSMPSRIDNPNRGHHWICFQIVRFQALCNILCSLGKRQPCAVDALDANGFAIGRFVLADTPNIASEVATCLSVPFQ